jgi:sentrin-specific protease 8
MTQSSDDVREIFLNPQNCDDRNLIIFALNDSSTFDSSGTHWSLLAFSRNEDKFFHFDSMGGGNNSQSRKLVNILKAALDVKSAEIVQVDCLQQNNSYDCGIFVLCLAKNICIHFLKHRRVADVKRLKIEEIYKKRNHLLEIIKNLKE